MMESQAVIDDAVEIRDLRIDINFVVRVRQEMIIVLEDNVVSFMDIFLSVTEKIVGKECITTQRHVVQYKVTAPEIWAWKGYAIYDQKFNP